MIQNVEDDNVHFQNSVQMAEALEREQASSFSCWFIRSGRTASRGGI